MKEKQIIKATQNPVNPANGADMFPLGKTLGDRAGVMFNEYMKDLADTAGVCDFTGKDLATRTTAQERSLWNYVQGKEFARSFQLVEKARGIYYTKRLRKPRADKGDWNTMTLDEIRGIDHKMADRLVAIFELCDVIINPAHDKIRHILYSAKQLQKVSVKATGKGPHHDFNPDGTVILKSGESQLIYKMDKNLKEIATYKYAEALLPVDKKLVFQAPPITENKVLVTEHRSLANVWMTHEAISPPKNQSAIAYSLVIFRAPPA